MKSIMNGAMRKGKFCGIIEDFLSLAIVIGVLLSIPAGAWALTINDTGGDCSSIGAWDSSTKTCTLNTDVYETIGIGGSNITLDGAGYTLSGPGSGNGIVIPAGVQNVTIKNLVIETWAAVGSLDAAINISGSYPSSQGNHTIQNNTITGSARGIWLIYTNGNTLSGNTITSSYYNGIQGVFTTNNNTISGNVISSTTNGSGITMGATGNVITGNTVNSNSGSGMDLTGTDLTVANNTVSSNGVFGIELGGCSNSAVMANTTNDNNSDGIYLSGGASNNTVSGNTSSFNKLGGGITLWAAGNNNIIMGNTANSNGTPYGRSGIYLVGSHGNTIDGNTTNSNTWSGVRLWASNNNTIKNNNIGSNARGFDLSTVSSTGNTIYHNNIVGNGTPQALDNNPTLNNWHEPTLLEGNYWSDYTGVDDGSGTGKHAIAGDGIGDTFIPHPGPDFDYYPFVNLSGWELKAPLAYVTNLSSGTVSAINSATNTVIATIPVEERPSWVAITPDGTRAYVTHDEANVVSVIDTNPSSPTFNTKVATVLNAPASNGVAITPDGTRAYVTGKFTGTVSVIDTVTNTVIATISGLDVAPSNIAITPDGTRGYVTHSTYNRIDRVSVIDTNPASLTYNTRIAIVTVGGLPYGVAITPDGTRAYVANAWPSSNTTVSVIDINPASDTYNTVIANVPFGAWSAPIGVAVTPDGNRAYVTLLYDGVSVIDTNPASTTYYNQVIATVGVGSDPVGVAITPDGTMAYVANSFSNTVSVIDTASNTQINTVAVGSYPGSVAFTPSASLYTVTASVAGDLTGGSVSPSSQTVSQGVPAIFTVTTNVGYTASVSEGTLSGSTWTIPNVTSTHTATVTFTIITYTYTVTVSVVNPAGGSVTPPLSQTVNYGGTATFTVNTNAGYTASVSEGSLVGTTWTIPNVTSTHPATVTFTINTYSITVFPVPDPTTGTISCNPTTVNYGGGSTCTITPSSSYYIASVSIDGSPLVGTPSSYPFENVTANHTISASFAANPTISGTVTLSGSGGLSGVTMNGLPGNPVTNASGFYTAPVDYGWTGTVTPTLAGYSFSPVSANYSGVISSFIQDYTATTLSTYTLTVTTSGTGTGTVTSSPAGINCGSDCSEAYSSGTLVTLTATPDASSFFTGWSGACSGTGACTVTMDAAKTVNAQFSPTSDTFDQDFIDRTVWADLEFVRRINGGVLESALTAYGLWTSNSLAFVNPESVNSFQADVTVKEVNNEGAWLRARLVGNYYSDVSEHPNSFISAQIGIKHEAGSLKGYYGVVRCLDQECLPGSSETLAWAEPIAWTVNFNDIRTLFIAWDGATTTFTFNFAGSQVVFNAGTLAPYKGPPEFPWRSIETRVSHPNTSASGGYISATFDNVYKNGASYDDFNDPSRLIEETRWTRWEFVRRAEGGMLESALARYGSNGSNNMNFVNAKEVMGFQADVTVAEADLVSNGSWPQARLMGAFYNDGTLGSGMVGDIVASMGIRHNGTQPVAFYAVTRCSAPGCNLPGEYETLNYHEDLRITNLLNQPHRLSLSWNGAEFIFGFDQFGYSYNPTGTGVVGPPKSNVKGIGTRVSGIDNSEESGYVAAAFDNVVITKMDSDLDGIDDAWEITYFGSTAACNPNADPDGDGLTNLQEYQLGTNPKVADQGISGRVVDASNGQPISNVDVWAQDLNGNWMGGTRTDSNGNYAFSVPAGDYKVGFNPWAAAGYYAPEWYNNKSNSNEADSVTVIAGQTTSGIDAKLETGGAISGRVTDTSTPPLGIANINVSACDSNGNCQYGYGTQTGSTGDYTFNVPAGSWKVFFNNWQGTGFYLSEWYDNENNPADATPITVISGQPTTGINAQLEIGGKISGVVTDTSSPTANPIANVDVWAQDFLTGNWMGGSRTDSNGNYSFIVPAGDYKVGFNPSAAGGYFLSEWYNDKRNFNEADKVTVTSPGDSKTLDDAKLETGGAISGRVTDTSTPLLGIANINVSACDSNGNCQYGYGTQTNSTGDYTLNVPAGTWKVFFNNWQGTGFYLSEWYDNENNPADATPVTVISGQPTTGINAQLEIGGKISGVVTDTSSPTANPIANVDVWAQDFLTGNWMGGSRTDSNGNYSFIVPAGDYKVGFNPSAAGGSYLSEWYNDKRNFNEADKVTVTSSGQTITLIDTKLEIGGKISGQVTDAGGVPLAKVPVNVHGSNWGSGSCTENNGSYTISGIPPDTYRVSAGGSNWCGGQFYRQIFYDNTPDWNSATLIPLTEGETRTGINFSNLMLDAAITGRITGDPDMGILGINVVLHDSLGRLVNFQEVGDWGGYYFGNLTPGPGESYTVKVYDPFLRYQYAEKGPFMASLGTLITADFDLKNYVPSGTNPPEIRSSIAFVIRTGEQREILQVAAEIIDPSGYQPASIKSVIAVGPGIGPYGRPHYLYHEKYQALVDHEPPMSYGEFWWNSRDNEFADMSTQVGEFEIAVLDVEGNRVTATANLASYTQYKLAIPTLNDPGDLYPVTPGIQVYPNDLTLSWNPVDGAESYTVRIMYLGERIWKENTTGTQLKVPAGILSEGRWYSWNIMAYDNADRELIDYASVSETRSFFTGVTPPPGPLSVQIVPWISGSPLIPHDAYAGRQTTLKAVAKGGTPPYTYTWDFGDGSTSVTATTSNRYNLEAVHSYPSGSDAIYEANITVTDDAGTTVSAIYPVRFWVDPSRGFKVNVAIDDTLWWLHKNMSRFTSAGIDYGQLSPGSNPAGSTALALQAWVLNGHGPDGDPNNPYVEDAIRAKNYILGHLHPICIGLETVGGIRNPDSNGNGKGLYVKNGHRMYETGLVLMALATLKDPDLTTTIQDLIDYLAYAQVEPDAGGGRGGWRYDANYRESDMSVTQFPLIGLEAAEYNLGPSVTIPPYVKEELKNNFLYFVQSKESGGFGYSWPNSLVNVAKTGAGLVGLALTGIPYDDPRTVQALSYIDREWLTAMTWPNIAGMRYNIRDLYAMYAVMKGMKSYELRVGPENTRYIGSHDWYNEYATWEIQNQYPDGRWQSPIDINSYGPVIDTAFGVLILLPQVFAIGPTAIAQASPTSVEVGQPVTFDHSQSFHRDTSKRIVSYEWDFDGDGAVDWWTDKQTLTHQYFYSSPGTYTATLRVTDNKGVVDTDQITITVILVTGPPTPPDLSFPTNGASGVSINPTFSWNASTGADSYQLQVSTDSGFGTTVFKRDGLTSTSQTVNGLLNNTIYYWRVNARNAQGTSGWSSVWSFTTVAACPAPETPSNPSPTGAGVSIAGQILSWANCADANSYDVYFGTSANPSFVGNVLGTIYSLPALNPNTTYYWKIVAKNNCGNSSSGSVWNFTTESGIPPSPTLISPSNGETGVVLNPTLSWHASNGATSYWLQVSTDNFSTFIFDGSLAGTTQALSGLLNETTYSWRVNATNTQGTSTWSDVWTFITQPPYGNLFIGARGMEDPDNDFDGIDDVLWEPVLGTDPTKKTLFVRPKKEVGLGLYEYWDGFIALFPDSRPGFANIPPLTNAGIEVVVIGAPGHQYSAFDNFNYDPATDPNHPNCDILEIVYKGPTAYCAEGSHNYGHTYFYTSGPNWSWDTKGYCPSTPGPYGYKTPRIYPFPLDNYLKEGAYSSIAVGQIPVASSCTSTNCTSSSPMNVNGTDAVNGRPDNTVEFNPIAFDSTAKILFITPPLPSTGYDRDTVLRRTIVHEMGHALLAGLDSDHCADPQCIMYSSVKDWGPYNFGGPSGCTHKSGGSKDIRANGIIHNSVHGVATALSAPNLSSPTNGATGVSTTPTLIWNTSSGATSYGLQVSTSSSFSTTVVNQTGITSTSYAVSGLASNTIYYWRVNATNTGGTSSWSTAWSFTTIATPPAAPTLNSPTNGATGVSLTDTLRWNAVTGATSYRLQVSTSNTFSTTVIDDSAITTASYAVPSGKLVKNTRYYWRVNATNAGGTSAWSTVWSFTTVKK